MFLSDIFKDRDNEFTILSFIFMMATFIFIFRLIFFTLFEFPVLPFKLIIEVLLKILLTPIELFH